MTSVVRISSAAGPDWGKSSGRAERISGACGSSALCGDVGVGTLKAGAGSGFCTRVLLSEVVPLGLAVAEGAPG